MIIHSVSVITVMVILTAMFQNLGRNRHYSEGIRSV